MTDERGARLIGAVTVGWLACFTYLTLSPSIPDVPFLADADRVLGAGHFVASLILAVLVHLWLTLARPELPPARTALTAFALASGFGLLVELVQFPVPDREPQLIDAVLDVLGSALGVALVAPVPRRVLRHPRAVTSAGVAGAVLVAGTAGVAIWGSTPTPDERRCPGSLPGDELPPADGEPSADPAGRVEDGLVVQYLFPDGEGAASGPVDDLAGLDLEASGAVEPLDPRGVRIADDDGVLATAGAVPQLVEAVDDGFTVEAWVRPQRLTQSGPARIVSLAGGTDLDEIDLQLGQDRHCLSVRVDTGGDEAEWRLVEDVFDSEQDAWHLVVTYDDGELVVWVDGERRARERLDGSDLSGWDDDVPLAVGNEETGERPFLGDIHLVALYDRPLDADEVAANHEAGP